MECVRSIVGRSSSSSTQALSESARHPDGRNWNLSHSAPSSEDQAPCEDIRAYHELLIGFQPMQEVGDGEFGEDLQGYGPKAVATPSCHGRWLAPAAAAQSVGLSDIATNHPQLLSYGRT